MNQKHIITGLIIFLLISFTCLAWIEQHQHNLNDQWFLYFQNPGDNSLNFIIENHTNNADFKWEILKDDNKIREDNVRIKNGEKKIVEIIHKLSDGKIIIKVSQEKDKKEIYKIL